MADADPGRKYAAVIVGNGDALRGIPCSDLLKKERGNFHGLPEITIISDLL